MRVRPVLLAALAAGALTAPMALAAPAAPQVTDAAGDANFTPTAVEGGQATPVGNQAYADVLSVTWTADRTRMLGTTSKCPFLGPVFYTDKSSDPGIPQSALRDNCTGVTRLTPIPMPVVDGATITWKVPVSALPKEAPVGTVLSGPYFEVNEIEDFQGVQVPAGAPVVGGAYGLGTGQVDDGRSEATFALR